MRVAIYARVSKAEREDNSSVPVQLADCRARAEQEGWQVVGEYADTGISAWNPRQKRPELERLLGEVEAGRVGTILVREQERLLRQLADTKRIQDLAEVGKLKLIACTMESDLNFGRARDRDDFRKRASQAQFYSDFLSEKVRATKAAQQAAGAYTGGEREPYGYKRTKGGLVVDPEEAAVLRDAISRLSRGESQTRIIREWNAAGIKTSHGARWNSLGLRRVLLSEHLTGGRGYPRVLTDEEAAVARSALNSTQRRTGRPPGVRSPLAGFLLCDECGIKLSSGGLSYRCPISHGGCGRVAIRSLPLERFVLLESLKHWLALGRPGNGQPSRAAANLDDSAPLLAELHRLEDREAELATGLADGTLSVQVAGEASKRITERRRELTEVLSRSLLVPASEPVVTSLVEVFSDDELFEAGLLTARTPVNASRPFRAKWEARDAEAVAQVRTLYEQVLGTVTIKRREVRGRGFDPGRCVISWRF